MHVQRTRRISFADGDRDEYHDHLHRSVQDSASDQRTNNNNLHFVEGEVLVSLHFHPHHC